MKLTFGKVTEKHHKIAIVATGSSLKGVDLKFDADVAVIAVNGAINHLERADYWFTLDPSPSNTEIMREAVNRPTTKHYAAVPEDYRPVSDRICHLHRIAGTGHGRYRTKGRLSRDKGAINTGNSGWGAFQLGAHMEPRYMAIFGIDGHGAYHYGGNPKELGMLTDLFASSVPDLEEYGITVRNGSPNSIVTCFPTLHPAEALDWLNAAGKDERT